MQIMYGFRASAALKGALDLGLFTALGGEARTAAAVAESIGASEPRDPCPVRFSDYHWACWRKDGAEYRCSPDSALFLDENSPAYFGSVGRFMMGPDVASNFSDLAAVVRKGGTLLDGEGTVEPENPLWVDFARSMAPLMKPSAEFIADLVTRDIDAAAPLKVLDLRRRGTGCSASRSPCGIAEAQIVALDWPAVLEVAMENAAERGCG